MLRRVTAMLQRWNDQGREREWKERERFRVRWASMSSQDKQCESELRMKRRRVDFYPERIANYRLTGIVLKSMREGA